MRDIIKNKYWSKSEAFLLPLTGLSKSQKYEMTSYLFWENYTIEDYQLIVKFSYPNYEEFLPYCRRVILTTLNKNNYIIECFDTDNETVFVLDMSDWSNDIEMFLSGKYSKMSTVAKNKIREYHRYFDEGPRLDIHIRGSLEPNTKLASLNNMTPIEYICQESTYGFSLPEIQKIGEIADKYNKKNETLSLSLTEKQDIT